jgi:RNA polymerase sigma-70 factor (ECF subfamily)
LNAADEDIARRIARGEPAAFDEFFDRYAARLLSYLEGMVRDRNGAEDLLQETLVRVWSHIGRYREQGRFRAWVFRIATNLALTELRRRRYRGATALDRAARQTADTRAPDPHQRLEREERGRLLAEAIERLPDDQRAVVLMRVRGGMALAEISAALRIPEGTVKSRLHQSVQRLRKDIDRRHEAASKERLNEPV